MAYCYKNGKQLKVTRSLLVPSDSSDGYSPQMTPYKGGINSDPLYSKNTMKCILAIIFIMFIIFY